MEKADYIYSEGNESEEIETDGGFISPARKKIKSQSPPLKHIKYYTGVIVD